MLIYVVRTGELSAECVAAMERGLPPVRRFAADRLRREENRRESIAAAWLALGAIGAGRVSGDLQAVDPARLPFPADAVKEAGERYGWPVGEHGQPFPSGIDRGGARLFVSLSHSGGYALAAAAAEPVGADIQVLRGMPADGILRIAGKLHPREQARLEALAESDPAALEAAFCALWAAKESALKLTGTGLSGGLDSFCVAPDGSCRIGGRAAVIRQYRLADAAVAAATWRNAPS